MITWYAIRQATSYEALIKDVPLSVQRGDGWSVLDRSAAKVDILFSGTLQDLRALNRDQIKVEIDTRDIKTAGTSVHRIAPRHVTYAGGARVARIDPDLVRLSMDREVVKTVPVRADIVGSPPEGIEVVKVECAPATAEVHGPRQRLEAVDSIRALPIDLEGRMRSFQLTQRLQEPSANWSARVEPSEVRISVTLVERRSSRTVGPVRVRPLLGAGESTAFSMTPAEVTVRLEGEVSALEQLKETQLLAFVDCANVNGMASTGLTVRISAPVGLRAVAVDPPTVSVSRRTSAETP